MAHLKRSSSTGHLLKTTGGHLVLSNCVPDSCPGGLADEYDVTICGTTKTVPRSGIPSEPCVWEWTGTPFTGCGGATFDRILLHLGGGQWTLTCDQFMGDVCTYRKNTGAVPTGTYTLDIDGAGGGCEATATVSEA